MVVFTVKILQHCCKITGFFDTVRPEIHSSPNTRRWCTHRSNIDKTNQKANDADDQSDVSLPPLGELVADDGDDVVDVGCCRAHTQRKQHQEEQDREQLSERHIGVSVAIVMRDPQEV